MTAPVPPLAALLARIGSLRAVLPMLSALCLAGTGSAMLTTAVSLHLSGPGTDPMAVQLVLTAYPVGFLIGCLIARALVARAGHERSFTLIMLLAGAGAIGLSLTTAQPAWMLFRLLGGMAMSALFVICESWINLYAGRANRGRLFSVYMLTTALAVLIGQLLVAAVGPQSPYLFLGGAATMLVALVAKLTAGRWPELANLVPRPGARPSAADERYGLKELVRLAPVTVVAIFQAGITNLNIFVLTPLYGAGIGLSPATTVGLVTTVSIAGMLAQTPVGWLSDRFDRRLILLVQGLLSVALCAAIAGLGNRSEPLLFALFFLYGATALTVYPVAIAFANAQLDPRHMVAASGALLLLYSVGNILTPGLAAGLMARTAPAAMLAVLGTGAVLVAAAACYNLRRPAVEAPATAAAEPLSEAKQ